MTVPSDFNERVLEGISVLRERTAKIETLLTAIPAEIESLKSRVKSLEQSRDRVLGMIVIVSPFVSLLVEYIRIKAGILFNTTQ